MVDEKKKVEPVVNKFIKPDFNNPNNLKGHAFNAPKGMPGGFAPGTFKTQHKG